MQAFRCSHPGERGTVTAARAPGVGQVPVRVCVAGDDQSHLLPPQRSSCYYAPYFCRAHVLLPTPSGPPKLLPAGPPKGFGGIRGWLCSGISPTRGSVPHRTPRRGRRGVLCAPVLEPIWPNCRLPRRRKWQPTTLQAYTHDAASWTLDSALQARRERSPHVGGPFL